MGPSDYQLGTSYTKEFSLIGRDNKTEKLMVMQKSSLFNKDFKVVLAQCQRQSVVKERIFLTLSIPRSFKKHGDDLSKNVKMSKCGESGCKDEPLAAEEEERVFHLQTPSILFGYLYISSSNTNFQVFCSGIKFFSSIEIPFPIISQQSPCCVCIDMSLLWS